MKTKIIFLTLLFALISLPLFSQEPGLNSAWDRVVDRAGLLNTAQKDSLLSRMDYLAKTYNFDLVIVTENSIGDTYPVIYADDFFDDNGFGLGDDRDGCLFLIVTETRDYWFSTSGRGIKILNNRAFDKLEAAALKFLKGDNYYEAFVSFLDNWEQFLILNAKNRSYNFFYQHNVIAVIVVWLIALGIGFIVVQVWKSGMNTALPKTQANAYMVPGSLAFNTKTDRFLYSTVTKTARPTESSSSGGGGSHSSSSGRSHGGGGGKY